MDGNRRYRGYRIWANSWNYLRMNPPYTGPAYTVLKVVADEKGYTRLVEVGNFDHAWQCYKWIDEQYRKSKPKVYYGRIRNNRKRQNKT